MKQLKILILNMFSRGPLPKSIEFVDPLPEIGAKFGDVYEYDNGYWRGPGNYYLMAHAVQILLRRGSVKVKGKYDQVCGVSRLDDSNHFVSVRNNVDQ